MGAFIIDVHLQNIDHQCFLIKNIAFKLNIIKNKYFTTYFK